MCTVLPLTSCRLGDKKWYHIDLDKRSSTAMIEQVKNVSKLRIIEPQRIKGKITRITQKDFDNINSALEKYYKLQKFPK